MRSKHGSRIHSTEQIGSNFTQQIQNVSYILFVVFLSFSFRMPALFGKSCRNIIPSPLPKMSRALSSEEEKVRENLKIIDSSLVELYLLILHLDPEIYGLYTQNIKAYLSRLLLEQLIEKKPTSTSEVLSALKYRAS